MTENTAPNTAEKQRTVHLSNDDQEDHRADCTTPAVKKLKLAYKQFASPCSSGGRPQGRFWPFFFKSAVKQNQHHCTAYCGACTLNGSRAQLRQESNRNRQPRKRARAVTTASGSASCSAQAVSASASQDQLMDLDALLSASEFRSVVNEWLDDLDIEDRDAAIVNLPAFQDSIAVVSAPLSSIFRSALPPLLDDDSLAGFTEYYQK
ncbi:hypothetical protein ABBQ32_004064 [Trebouxia sp. C0010 RCD-2024]